MPLPPQRPRCTFGVVLQRYRDQPAPRWRKVRVCILASLRMPCPAQCLPGELCSGRTSQQPHRVLRGTQRRAQTRFYVLPPHPVQRQDSLRAHSLSHSYIIHAQNRELLLVALRGWEHKAARDRLKARSVPGYWNLTPLFRSTGAGPS